MKKNLGRGLASLMGNFEANTEREVITSARVASEDRIYHIPIDKIKANPNQPRKHFDEETLQELAKSIEKSGVISPIMVKRIEDSDEFEIIAGERRFRATQYAGVTKIPAIIKDIEEDTAFELSIIENIQRQNLNVVEEAKSYKELMSKCSYSQNEVAIIVGKSRSHVTNILRLLNLPQPILDMLVEEKITMGHARALIGVENAEKLAINIAEKGLSVRDIEKIIKNKSEKPAEKNPVSIFNSDAMQSDIKLIEELLEKRLNTQVKINSQSRNKGTISINYNSLEQLDKILQLLGNASEEE